MLNPAIRAHAYDGVSYGAEMGRMRRSVRVLLRRAAHSILSLHGSPRDIALGTAIGVFVAFTPTVGLQMLIAALIATLVRANRPAAVIGPWITNPLTIPPIYALTYWIGTFFRKGPAAGEVYHRLVAVVASLKQFSWFAFHKQLTSFLRASANVFVQMMIGGIIVGLICAGISYPLMLRAVNRYRRRRLRKRHLREIRPADRDGTTADS